MKGCHVDQKHVKKVCTETLKKLTKLEVDKRTVFFQQRGNTLIHSFFELLAENKVSSEFPLFFSFCYIYLKVLSEFLYFFMAVSSSFMGTKFTCYGAYDI